jgi:hypothetical protein
LERNKIDGASPAQLGSKNGRNMCVHFQTWSVIAEPFGDLPDGSSFVRIACCQNVVLISLLISSKAAKMVLTITLPDRYGYVILGNVVLPFFVGFYMSTSVRILGGKSKRFFFRSAPCFRFHALPLLLVIDSFHLTQPHCSICSSRS